jgi:dipeptidyl aminopeptidase/acylaminoacyl peptidase
MRSLSFLLLLFPVLLFAQKDKKWDVNNPEGLPYKDVEFQVNEGTWMNLDVSPDGTTLAFDLLGDIYTMPIAGGTATCLRSGIAWEVQPRFSPDGKQILFTSDAGGGDNVWVMNADGSKARQVTKESFRLLNNGVWLGNDDNSPTKRVTGGSLPALVWKDVMEEAHKGLPPRILPGRMDMTDPETGLVVSENTPTDVFEEDPQIAEEDVIPEPRQRKRKRGLLARIFGIDEDDPPIIERRPRRDGTLY